MILKSMTATFGKLNNKTLTLQPGLNIIEAPNEWGKSTWCAFLAAMLYGLDTRAKSTKTVLADKERFHPWSGVPMAGRMVISWQGRDITIERKTRGRIPLGDFRAYETASGLTVAELSAANCGQVLLGVEKSVFLRSALIRQNDLPVTGDESLRRRLQDLVTTGDETGAGENLAKQLKDLKNRCRYHRTGLIPQAEAERQELETGLNQFRSLETAIAGAEDKIAQNRDWLTRLEQHRAYLNYRAALEDEARVNRAEKASRAEENRVEGLLLDLEALPSRETLGEQLDILESREAERKAQLRKKVRLRCLGVLVLLAGIPLGIYWKAISGLISGGLGLLLVLAGLIGGKMKKSAELEACRSQWEAQEKLYRELAEARQDLRRSREYAQTLRAMAKPLTNPAEPVGLALNMEETARKLEEVRAEQVHLENRRSQYLGRMEALGDRADWKRRLAGVKDRIEKLEQTYAALTLAQETLAEASAQLQRRFAPKITEGAAWRMGRLTRGRYDRIRLNEDLGLLAAAEGEETLREIGWRSAGTADQLYLALRLAVSEALIPESPLILDDALVRFDDERLKAALSLLNEEAQSRQVILFTCQSREKNWMKM